MNLEKVIEEIGKQLGSGADKIIPYYVQWYIYSSIIWCTGMIGLAAVSYIFFFKKKILFNSKDEDDKNISRTFNYIVGGALMFLAAIIFMANLEDLVAPTAAAYHQLLHDLAGLKK